MKLDLPHARVELDTLGIATLTICNAGSLNILGTPVIDDLRKAFEAVATDETVRVVILRGTGDKAFVAGADIKEMGALDRASARRFIDGLRRLCEAVRQCPAPVIARIPGWTLGGGLELAIACDLRIAADSAMLGMPEVVVGIPSIIHAALLPRLIGEARAGWMLLTGENIDCAKAQEWGLVDAMVPMRVLDTEVTRMAGRLASHGPQVMRQQKRLLRQWQQQPLDVAILEGVDEFAKAFDTGEPQRFMAEFAQRKAQGVHK
ncbi:enoyl-CoA hydratase [Variovorax rhizosphaerae]|uniref:Enoyl-CoA hydratase n=1 Tax=Variovorax rhizosphaerae TaxID=1836200 RepID=A0ABU8X094_9BURK